MGEQFRIRPATADDLSEVVRVESASFPNPWDRADFREFLDDVFLVGEEPAGTVVGFAIGRSGGGEGEILNVAVTPEVRRRGIGRRLLVAVLESVAAAGAEDVYLEVRQSNAAAMAMYRNEGFRAVGLRVSYYRNPPENAVVMHRANRV